MVKLPKETVETVTKTTYKIVKPTSDEGKCEKIKKDGSKCTYSIAEGNRKFCNKHSEKAKKKEKDLIVEKTTVTTVTKKKAK